MKIFTQTLNLQQFLFKKKNIESIYNNSNVNSIEKHLCFFFINFKVLFNMKNSYDMGAFLWNSLVFLFTFSIKKEFRPQRSKPYS